ncbi:IclR family transcriptional regulator [Caldalkalibacillus salinus]|uniref:IclR family transcriptional regulator n=1 Tax=Caldalkalibacillus salinus TaxID=2803787 RepID=UPI001922003A|nr:IclR family transcriptional regulator [Caldalkalibacillus salinus]
MNTVQSIDRAVAILKILSDAPTGLSVTDIAKKLGLAKSTTHRLLNALLHHNIVKQDTHTQHYSLGLYLFTLASSVFEELSIREVARPHLERLCHKTNEVVHLCIQDHLDVLYIDKIESNSTIRIYSKIGRRTMFHCTSAGKALLAGMEDQALKQLVLNYKLQPFTDDTITDPLKLIKEIKEVRSQGYALDNMEHVEGVRCIGAPIYNHEGQVVASFSLSGPSERMDTDRIANELVPIVIETSQNISKLLGY